MCLVHFCVFLRCVLCASCFSRVRGVCGGHIRVAAPQKNIHTRTPNWLSQERSVASSRPSEHTELAPPSIDFIRDAPGFYASLR
uniref:Putative secreted protein n=1 Tax=Anopheles marajoara TaxID=58244 RepID=A0A2M4CBL2_9DIPT